MSEMECFRYLNVQFSGGSRALLGSLKCLTQLKMDEIDILAGYVVLSFKLGKNLEISPDELCE
jgi:hypothetical protein